MNLRNVRICRFVIIALASLTASAAALAQDESDKTQYLVVAALLHVDAAEEEPVCKT